MSYKRNLVVIGLESGRVELQPLNYTAYYHNPIATD